MAGSYRELEKYKESIDCINHALESLGDEKHNELLFATGYNNLGMTYKK